MIKVNSELLTEALEAAGPKINNFTSTLDAISADIRTLEKWLLQSGVRLEISELIEKESDPDGRGYGYNDRYLVWYGGKDSKTWRIYYRDNRGVLESQEDP